MDSIPLRSPTDCRIMTQISDAYELLEEIWFCKPEIVRENAEVREVWARLKAVRTTEKLTNLSYMQFNRRLAFNALLLELQRIFEGEKEEEITAETVEDTVTKELENYWRVIDELTPERAVCELTALIETYCKLQSRGNLAMSPEKESAGKPPCWLCVIDSAYVGMGRPDNLCGLSLFDERGHKNYTNCGSSFVNTEGGLGYCNHVSVKRE